METEQVAVLALADGALFHGRPFGAPPGPGAGHGEVVFATAMTGYQEICTDPSYRGQVVALTYPLVGNYGVIPPHGESRRPWLSALLVRECCEEYSHWSAAESLGDYLARWGVPGMCELDTRALTRHLRDHGTQRGILRAFPAGTAIDEAALRAEARAAGAADPADPVGEVTLGRARAWSPAAAPPLARARGRGRGRGRPLVALIDTGYKENIARCLDERGLDVLLAPPDVGLRRLRALGPDGVLLGNGPGDPQAQVGLVALVRALLGERRPPPLMGICLGHQIIGLAAGATTSRLPFGHHGANHPVIESQSRRVTITSQNHDFQVDAASLPAASGFRISHRNLLDGSVEGLEHERLPVFSVQYHPEACPGPEENRALFDRFADLVRRERALRESQAPDALLVG
jgi:carbamoyl-phosphate synthase small subunit